MTFEKWWENESGCGGLLLAEGQLAKAAWNAAIESTKKSEVSDEDFERIWKLKPNRSSASSNPKQKARKAFNARLREGDKIEDIESGVLRYAECMKAVGKEGTELVMQMATFLGPDKHYLEPWDFTGVEKKKPDWAKLPYQDEDLVKFAEKHGLMKASAGWSYQEYRRKLQAEIERRLQND